MIGRLAHSGRLIPKAPAKGIQNFHSMPFNIIKFGKLNAFGHPLDWHQTLLQQSCIISDSRLRISANLAGGFANMSKTSKAELKC